MQGKKTYLSAAIGLIYAISGGLIHQIDPAIGLDPNTAVMLGWAAITLIFNRLGTAKAEAAARGES